MDAEAITHLDYSAARRHRAVAAEAGEFRSKLGFARMPFGLRADFARHRLTEVIDANMIFNRLHEALAAFEKTDTPLKARSRVGRVSTPLCISSHYHPVLLLTSAVLRKDCGKFWPNRYAHFQAAIPKTL